MGFQAGQPKPEGSGRKAGTPNRPTKKLEELLAEHGIRPIEEMAALLPHLEPAKRVDVMLKLADFIWPRRKAIEVQADESKTDSERAAPSTIEEWQTHLFVVRQQSHGAYESPRDSLLFAERDAYRMMQIEPSTEKVAEWDAHREEFQTRNRLRLERTGNGDSQR